MFIAVIGRCLPSSKDSFGKFEFDQARALTRFSEHDVIYCFSDNRSIKAHHRFGPESIELDGIRVVGRYFPAGGLPWKAYNVARFQSQKRMIQDVIREYGKPDIVYAHFPALSLSDALIEELKRLEISLVIMEHWSKVKNKNLNRNRLSLLQHAVDYSKSTMCVSDDLADSLAQLTGIARKCIDVVPNMVNAEIFHPVSMGDGLMENRREHRVFVSAGRLAKIKQFDLLIKAFAAMHGNKDCELQIAGSGKEAASLKRLARSLGVADRIHFLGWVDSCQMATLLADADCFVLANGNETFALPFAEAWMCGAYCIGADNNPLRSYFDNDRGKLFKAGEVSSLAQAMESVEKTHGSSSLAVAEWAKGLFSEEAVVTQILNHM